MFQAISCHLGILQGYLVAAPETLSLDMCRCQIASDPDKYTLEYQVVLTKHQPDIIVLLADASPNNDETHFSMFNQRIRTRGLRITDPW